MHWVETDQVIDQGTLMDNKDNKRKTFIYFFWPYLLIALGPIVLYLIFAIVFSLVTKTDLLIDPKFYGTVIGMFLYFWLFKLGYWGYAVTALILSIPLQILLIGAIISAKKAKKARSSVKDS